MIEIYFTYFKADYSAIHSIETSILDFLETVIQTFDG